MKEILTISEAADKAESIKEVILAYCQGTDHLEFDKENLGEMVGKITNLISRRVREDHNEYGGLISEAIYVIEECGEECGIIAKNRCQKHKKQP